MTRKTQAERRARRQKAIAAVKGVIDNLGTSQTLALALLIKPRAGYSKEQWAHIKELWGALEEEVEGGDKDGEEKEEGEG